MNNNNRLNMAVDTFPVLEEHYIEFINDPESKLNGIEALTVLSIENKTLCFEVFGKLVEIRFSIVFQSDLELLGQASAFLIKNSENTLSSETHILSTWFNSFGDIKTETTVFSNDKVETPKALLKFVIQVLDNMLHLNEFSPRVNGYNA